MTQSRRSLWAPGASLCRSVPAPTPPETLVCPLTCAPNTRMSTAGMPGASTVTEPSLETLDFVRRSWHLALGVRLRGPLLLLSRSRLYLPLSDHRVTKSVLRDDTTRGRPEGVATDETQHLDLGSGVRGHLDPGPVLAGEAHGLLELLHAEKQLAAEVGV